MKISHVSRYRRLLPVLTFASLILRLDGAHAGSPDHLLFEAKPLSDATPIPAPAALSARRVEPGAPLPLFAALLPDFGGSARSAQGKMEAPQLQQSIAAYERSIAALQLEQGPYEAALAEQFLGLARLYLQNDEHAAARDVLAKAEHIARVNHGLHSPVQFPAIELSIESYLAQRDYQHAIERQEYLVYLHHAHYGRDAVEAVPELTQLGDMYFDAFQRAIHREPDNVELEFGPKSGFVDPELLSATEVSFLWLRQAQSHYTSSIARLIEHERYFDPQLLSLETNLIETLFLQAHRRYLELDPDFFLSVSLPNQRDVLQFDRNAEKLPGYREGEKAFSRILTYLANNPAVEPVQMAQAMIGLGDWHILFGKRKQGMAKYEEAHAYLQAAGVSSEVIANLLAPEVPVQLPTFMTRPNAPEAGLSAFEGYIDVAFTLQNTGEIGNIEVLDKSANADANVEMRLKRVLRNAPFRPRLAGIAPAAPERVAVRYGFAHAEGSGG